MEIIVGIIGNLLADLMSGSASLALADNVNWKKWKSEHNFSQNQSDFLDRYAETLVALKKAEKPKELLQFYGQESVIIIIHDYWYGELETATFEEKFNALTHWFTLDKQLKDFSAVREIFFFLTHYKKSVHLNRTAGEAEMFQILLEILSEIKKEKDFSRPDLYHKIFIFCNASDRQWVEQELATQLEKEGLEVHLDFRDYRPNHYSGWSQKVLACRKTLAVFSNNFSKNEKWLLDGFLNEHLVEVVKDKLLPIRLDGAPVSEEFSTYIDLFTGRNIHEGLQNLTTRLKPKLTLPSNAEAFPPLNPQFVDITDMPHGGLHNHLFGRQHELAMLDKAWEDPDTHIISFVAHGGVGKSVLVVRWLNDMSRDNYRGAKRVLATSFYSQGTGERVTNAEAFIARALKWFGEKDVAQLSLWEKGKHLAHLVNQHCTLLILDGLEPLQEGGVVDSGKIKDPGLFVLVRELARHNRGLCVITSRKPLGGMERQQTYITEQNLEQISSEAGMHILRFTGVRGSDRQLEKAVRDFDNHALAINLLGAWLYTISGHSIEKAADISDLPNVPPEKGKHPRRVIAAFEKWLVAKGKTEPVRLLQLLGLFDRPVPREMFAVVEDFQNLPDALAELRRRKLVYPESRHEPEEVDCHPLVREHFGEVLQKNQPQRWQKAHTVLYEYYKSLPDKHQPDTLEEMEPLFQAVRHGCMAGLYQETFDLIFWVRIQRGDTYFTTTELGAWGFDLSTLSFFFDQIWGKPINNLNKNAQARLLGLVGFRLRALGLLLDAISPLEASLELNKEKNDLIDCAIDNANLSDLYLLIGQIDKAIFYSQKSIEFADLSKNGFQRAVRRCYYAHALHQGGRIYDSLFIFLTAENILRAWSSDIKTLYSTIGYFYCDILVTLGKFNEAIERAKENLRLAKEYNQFVLAYATNNLIIGVAYLHLFPHQGVINTNALLHLSMAVEDLRKAGYRDFFSEGILARAAYHRLIQSWQAAEEDLAEVLDIAEPSGMRLHLCDYHLESARLAKAMGKPKDARDHLEKAAELIQETGYHRRDGEVEALRKSLK